MHRSLMAYIAGTAQEKDLTIADAVPVVVAEFASDPQAAAENADMLTGFDPASITPAEMEEMYKILRGFRLLKAVHDA